MTNDVNVRRHLIILAGYSIVFSFVLVPYLYGSLQYGLLDWDWEAIGYGPIAIIPSIVFWLYARRELMRGTKPKRIHLLYLGVAVPAAYLLIAAIGTGEFFLWYFFGITR